MKYSLLLIISLFLLSACTGGGGTSVPASEIQDTYRTGWGSLDVSFIRNTPPKETYENSQIALAVNLQNKGAYKIDNGLLVITYDDDYIEFESSNSLIFNLEGKSPDYKTGEQYAAFFDARTYNLDIESSERSVPFHVSACFPYESILIENICLDLPYETSIDRGDKSCTFKDSINFGGQGSPVGVASASFSVFTSQATQSARLVADIVIRHTGNGLVVSDQAYSTLCGANIGTQYDALNKVRIEHATLSDIPMTCNRYDITLRNNEARVQCSIENIPLYLLPYEAPLRVELVYGYVESASAETVIKRG